VRRCSASRRAAARRTPFHGILQLAVTRRDTGHEGRSPLGRPFNLDGEISTLTRRLAEALLDIFKVAALEAVAQGLKNARSDVESETPFVDALDTSTEAPLVDP
jgi:hypothetical protein